MLVKNVSDLHLDPRNARRHGDADLEAIVNSLERFGQQTPIVIDASNVVVKGNGTLMAAMKLGWETIECIETKLSGDALKAYAIADNQTGLLSQWDEERLAQQIAELKESEEVGLIEALGFSEVRIEELLELNVPEVELEEDDVPSIQEKAVTKLGDIWFLGGHRLMCGSSTDAESVARLFNGRKADLVLTDPPYGVSYVGKTEEALTIDNDALDEDSLALFVGSAFDLAMEHSRPGAYWYATVPAGPLHILFVDDWKKRGVLRQIMVWAKDSMVLGHSEYHYRHEPILFGWVPGGVRHKNSDRTRTTLWEYDRPKASREHPTMKPIALWAQAIEDGSRRDELVYDPFLGSGTTVIAAEQLGRVCYGMELSPNYCDVICKRFKALTGLEPMLDSNSLTFAEVEAERK
jgi:DNA modification methylase